MLDLVTENIFRIAFVGALIAGWFLLRSRATTFTSPTSLDAALNSGQPVVLDFFRSLQGRKIDLTSSRSCPAGNSARSRGSPALSSASLRLILPSGSEQMKKMGESCA